jgi:hypothetical protein
MHPLDRILSGYDQELTENLSFREPKLPLTVTMMGRDLFGYLDGSF